MKNKDKETFSVEIGNKWKISADRYCYTLFRKQVRTSKSSNAGQVVYVTEGYYKTIDDVLNAIFDKVIKDGGNLTLTKLVGLVKDTRKDIKRYAEELKELGR